MLTSYYYNKQINRYIVQFANVFAGLSVRTGKGADGSIFISDFNKDIHTCDGE